MFNAPSFGGIKQQRGIVDLLMNQRPMQIAQADDPQAAIKRALMARQQFMAAPTDENAAAMGDAVDQAVGTAGTNPAFSKQINEIKGWINPGGPDYARPEKDNRSSLPVNNVVAANDTVKNDADGGSGIKLTEQQSKDIGFWNRMDGVSGDLNKYEGDLTSGKERALGSVPLVGNALVSDGYQRGNRAANEWITALLRKDTGAQVTNEEWKLYGPIYIPQFGDGSGVLADKRAARQRAADGLKAGLGTADVLANELMLERQKNAKAVPAGDPDAELFKKYGLGS